MTTGALMMLMMWASSPQQSLPTLDELLGLPVRRVDGEATPPTPQPTLQPADLFTAAVSDMDASAARLGEALDPGLPTQRMQRSAIQKLEQLIDELNRQSSSSSSSQPSDAGSAGQPSASTGSNAAGSTGDPGMGPESVGAVGEVARDGGELQEMRDRWGNLPPRVRDALSQGFQEPYSTVYRELTQQYYRKLAEEP